LRCRRHPNIDFFLFVHLDDGFFDAKPLQPGFDNVQAFKMLKNRNTCRTRVYLLKLGRERNRTIGF
jgi:hypothetical protein